MDVRFVGQPFGKATVGGALLEALKDEEATEVRMAVAWAKASGLTRVGRSLADFRDRRPGNRVEVIVGIDEGGATWEGLELARTVSSDAFVYHDTGARTFHPKVYAVLGPRRSTLIVGSGNGTLGGLFTNYEGAFVVTLGPDDNSTCRDELVAYLDNLLAQGGACKALDDELMKSLREGTYRIVSEVEANRRRRERRGAPAASGAASPLFTSVSGLGTPPTPQMNPVRDDAYDADEDLTPEPDETPSGPPVSADPPARDFGGSFGRRGFYKRLSDHDASLTQSPGQIIIPKQFEEYFPPLTLQWDQLSKGGSRQSEAKFPAVFRDGSFEKQLAEVRVIRYEPKPTHKRTNTELRFTFHDREVFRHFKSGDFIRFSATDDGECLIERVPATADGFGKFNWISTDN